MTKKSAKVNKISYGEAIREALHYWHQYKEDGEYSEIIGGKSVIDKLIAQMILK